MSTPAAKKRRVEAASATLKKPFRSPLLNRPKQDDADARQLESRPSTPLKDVASAEGDRAGEAAVTGIKDQTSPDRVHKRVKSLAMLRTPSQVSTNGMGGLLARLDRELGSTAKQLRHDKELVEQAEGIRRESEKKRPGEEVDIELKELIEKWKGASRLAADEVFGFVKERVSGYGSL